MKKIEVSIPNNSYNVYLGKSIFSELKNILIKKKCYNNTLLVIDGKVKNLFNKDINFFIDQFDYKIKTLTIHSSEKNKSFETLSRIHKSLIKNNFGRDSIIIALGGGIVGDITGFAASTYMRGVKYVQIPTTLLSAVDSSVGGKTGINFINTKNIIGTFYQPEFVLIDTNFFDTLPKEERLCGLGEVIKYGFLTNHKFFKYIQNNSEKFLDNDSRTVERIVAESVKFKSGVVEADEKEAGIRKILNLGHTFAHAFEIQQNHKLKHGQAVIVGIACAVLLSYKLKLITTKDKNFYLSYILRFKNKILLNKINKNEVYKIMLRDKKNRLDEIKFVLLKGIGEIITDCSAPKKEVLQSIDEVTNLFYS